MLYAAGSAFFASLTAILGKIGISGVESNLGTAIRTAVVLIMAWGMVFITGKEKDIKKIDRKELVFICLSGIATGVSWLCDYCCSQRERLQWRWFPDDSQRVINIIQLLVKFRHTE